jgi:hypothetical protein
MIKKSDSGLVSSKKCTWSELIDEAKAKERKRILNKMATPELFELFVPARAEKLLKIMETRIKEEILWKKC